MATRAAASAASVSTAIGSWDDLAGAINRAVSAGGYDLYKLGRRGRREQRDGPPSAHSQIRPFGVDERDIRVTLYRDNHAWCPYCHKVWMQLEEKRVPYRVEKISMNCYGDKKQRFLKKTPRGLLPALEIDGQFYTESSVIMQLIEDTFSDYVPLLPQEGPSKAIAVQLLSCERDLFGAWLQWLRGAESQRARASFENAMDVTELALVKSRGPYFLGRDFSLVDIVFASSLERIAASMSYYKGLQIKGGRWPNINLWFSAMEGRESYVASQSDFHTHVHDLPPQIGGCIASGSVEQRAMAEAIDGRDGKSWHLPLPPLAEDPLQPAVENPPLDRLEAANAVVHCHEGILKSSRSSEAAEIALRCVVRALVDGDDAVQNFSEAPFEGSIDPSAAAALRWTRDRICVPRDMSFPAARQLRAHLNWVADLIDPPVDGWRGVPIPTGHRRDMDPVHFAKARM